MVEEALIKRLKDSLGAVKKPCRKKYVKYMIASNFYVDGNIFIKRYDIALSSDYLGNTNYRSKMVVDLLMSIECSLKSLLITTSNDEVSAKEAYKKARKCGHNLDKLAKLVINQSKYKIRIPSSNSSVFVELHELGVFARYSFEIWSIKIKQKHLFCDNLVERTIENTYWCNRLRDEAIKWNILASNRLSALRKHTILSGKPLLNARKEVDDFVNDLK
ncbi:hypothetical protein A7985_05450 [Pseudoalteromonas luteoviolacea]|uniref:Uncharacterized protein n=1 Tax=Pseudoalteromonas luteoviolacea TaxID=43657 RepID=A0A1C0TVN3_9GAMM|nr:hypothetical protein [Pseudoalteromonas luteoviolacea]OCQ23386.1 hypothetical protein A7985_05450 [Pseudoalteromonas luteoviolacea]